MLPSKGEPDYIKEFNKELEGAYYKALANLCKATGKKLCYLDYNGFVMDYSTSDKVKLSWSIDAVLKYSEVENG
jgi:hypothetical protein